MNRTFITIVSLALLGLLAAVATIQPPEAFAVSELRSRPRAVEMPDLDKDPGMFFLMAEQSEHVGDAAAVLMYYRKAMKLDPTSAYLNTRVATIFARSKKLAEALIMARNATLFDPSYEEAHSLLGKIFTITGDRAKAIESYTRALDLKPDEAELYVFIGSLQASEKLYADAEKTFKRMISQFPEERDGYFYLGKVYVEDKQYDRAIETFKSLLEKRSDAAGQVHVELGAIAVLQQNYAEAENHFREAVKLDQFNVSARLNLGQVLAAQKKHQEALAVFEELAKLAPSNTGLQIKMALILADQQQFDKATEMLDTILQKKPEWDQVRFHLGQILREQGKPERAEQELVRIKKGQPTFLRSRIMLSIMFLKTKDLGKSIRYIDEAVDAAPKDPELLHIRGSILEELYRYNEAIKSYLKALEIEPGNIRIRYSLGNAFEKGGHRTRGLAEMERILAEKPDEASALNFVGYTLAASNKDTEKAEKLIRQAVALKPDDGYITDSLAYVLFKQGKYQEALELLKKSLEVVKGDPIIAEHFGDVLLALGRKEEAADAYLRSLKDNPENLVVQRKLRELEQLPKGKD